MKSIKDICNANNRARNAGKGLLLDGSGRAGAFKGNDSKKERRSLRLEMRKGEW